MRALFGLILAGDEAVGYFESPSSAGCAASG